jgi:NADPH2:quinone reductase
MPEPGPDEVVVEVEAVGVNFADVLMRRGRYRRDQQLPLLPGIEAAGRLADGTPVVAFVEGGGYADRVVAPARQVVPLPAGLTAADGAAVLVQGLTAWYALHRYGRLREGETLLVHAAAGGVGGLALQIAKAAGARVVATASTPEKVEHARARGADEALLGEPESLAEQVRELTGGRGVDVVADGVGGPLFAPGFGCLARGGRYVVYGQASGQPSDLDLRRLMPRGQTVVGFILRNVIDADPAEPAAAARRLFRLVEEGRLRLDVTTMPWEQVADAHRLMEERRHMGKLVLTI